MKSKALVYLILLSTIIILLLSITAQANEYKKVKAEDIIKQIENGEDVSLEHCYIVGELNLSDAKLKMDSNDLYYYLENGLGVEKLKFYRISKNLKLVESNITIHNSTFENGLNFSNALFKKSLSFHRANYYSKAIFSGSHFNNYIGFRDATFNCPADFNLAKFVNTCDFTNATFKGPTEFNYTFFDNTASLSNTSFINTVYFYGANFTGATYLTNATFNGLANFHLCSFKDTANFFGPKTAENIISDGRTSQTFIEYYKNWGQYENVDIIYYNYRNFNQAQKKWSDISKWTDFIVWVTCGYGVKPFHTFYFAGFLILLFSIIYAKGPAVSFSNFSNEKIPIRFYFQGPGIIMRNKSSEKQPQRVSFWDALNFSITTFTTVGYGNWYPKENFKKWATLEGLLGWIILGIFMATLSVTLIRV